MPKHKGGRPTKLTPIILNKLEEAFSIDATDEEACFYAGISPRTLYKYQLRNPKFVHRKEALKQKLILLARQTVAKNIKENYGNAMDYLKRKRKNEFSERQELTGADGKAIELDAKIQTTTNALNEILNNATEPQRKSEESDISLL